MQIRRISAQAFRGFPERVDVHLGGKVTLFYAPNGYGKTSLAEAFEWTLYDEVARKVRSNTKQEFGNDFLRSAHAPAELSTWAEVELVDKTGKSHIVRRTMNRGGDTLKVDGKEVADISALGVLTGLSFRPCLGQSEIKAFIDTEPKDRWKQISAILGLGGFEAVRDSLMQLKAETDRNSDVIRVREAARRVVAPFTPEGKNPLDMDPDALRNRLATELSLESSATWDEIQKSATAKIEKLLGADKRPPSLDSFISGPDDIEDGLEVEIEKISNGLESHREWHSKHKHAKFVAVGVEIAKPPTCPYCGEDTLTPAKAEELQKAVADDDPEPKELNSGLAAKAGHFQVISMSPVNLGVVGSIAEAIADTPDLVKNLQSVAERQNELKSDLSMFGNLLRAYLRATMGSDNTPLDEVRTLGGQILVQSRRLATNYGALKIDAIKVRDAILAKFKGLTPEERNQLSRLQAIHGLSLNHAYAYKAWTISIRQAELNKLVGEFDQGEKDTVQALESELSDDVRSYLDRLSNTGSIRFKRFVVKKGVRRQAGLEAEAYGVKVNPTSMFSEAQGNCLGLSLYFSQRIKRNPGWKSIILDDPVQSMDVGHQGNLIGLLSDLLTNYQIIVFTHDKSFRSSLNAQFQHEPQYLSYEINKSEDSPIPQISAEIKRAPQLINYARMLANGSSIERENAFNNLRKATENAVKGISVAKNVGFRKGMDLEAQINELIRLKAIDSGDGGTLNRIRNDTNPNSHDNESADAPGIIVGLANDLDAILAKYTT